MLPIVTDDSVTHCVSLSVMWLRCAKTAEWIKVLFGVVTFGVQRHIVSDGVPNLSTRMKSGGIFCPL